MKYPQPEIDPNTKDQQCYSQPYTRYSSVINMRIYILTLGKVHGRLSVGKKLSQAKTIVSNLEASRLKWVSVTNLSSFVKTRDPFERQVTENKKEPCVKFSPTS